MLVYYQETIHIGYWNHCSSLFWFRWHVYVERQSKSHQRIVVDLMTQLVSYHWRISKNAKGQEHEIFEMFEYLLSMLTKNSRSVKCKWNQLKASSRKLIAFNFSNSILWSILPNAFWRSISIILVKRPLLKPFKHFSFKYEWRKSV